VRGGKCQSVSHKYSSSSYGGRCLSVVAQLRLTACWQSGNLHYMVGHGRLLEVLYIIGLGDSRVPETKNMVLPTNRNQHRRLWRNLEVWYLR